MSTTISKFSGSILSKNEIKLVKGGMIIHRKNPVMPAGFTPSHSNINPPMPAGYTPSILPVIPADLTPSILPTVETGIINF